MTKKRPLTPEEKLLWKQVTKSVKRLKEPLLEPTEQATDETIKLTPQPQPKAENSLSTPVGRAREGLTQGNYAGIDRNTAEKFKKGKNEFDATLDLHGMTAEKAHKSLISFVNKHIKLESRRLLVITGKGSGILRAALPNWLTAPNLSPHILAFDTAQQKHGGSGAYYILLKRKRHEQ